MARVFDRWLLLLSSLVAGWGAVSSPLDVGSPMYFKLIRKSWKIATIDNSKNGRNSKRVTRRGMMLVFGVSLLKSIRNRDNAIVAALAVLLHGAREKFVPR